MRTTEVWINCHHKGTISVHAQLRSGDVIIHMNSQNERSMSSAVVTGREFVRILREQIPEERQED